MINRLNENDYEKTESTHNRTLNGDMSAELEQALAADADGDDIIPDEIKSMSTADIRTRTMMLRNELKFLRNESARLRHEQSSLEEQAKSNFDKVKQNKKLPYLIGNIVEVRRMVLNEFFACHAAFHFADFKRFKHVEIVFVSFFQTRKLFLSFVA